jgi:glycosyltransferase involved in cell wall biosynthesis
MLVSVVIPCYNVQDYLAECLDSVFAQTYEHIEVICIDNNSTDKTLAILQDYKKEYPQIIIEKEIIAGAPSARNKGLSLAKGEWVQFLDADDLLLPNKIKHQIDLLKQHDEQVPFIAAACYLQDTAQMQQIKRVDLDTWKGLFTTRLGNTCANLFRKTHLEESGAWNAKLQSSQEYELMFRLVQNYGSPLVDSEPLTTIRERSSGQISQRNPINRLIDYEALRSDILKYLYYNQIEYLRANSYFFISKFILILNRISTYDKLLSKEKLNVFMKLYSRTLPFGIKNNFKIIILKCKLFKAKKT